VKSWNPGWRARHTAGASAPVVPIVLSIRHG
jgi:hypothetical protein